MPIFSFYTLYLLSVATATSFMFFHLFCLSLFYDLKLIPATLGTEPISTTFIYKTFTFLLFHPTDRIFLFKQSKYYFSTSTIFLFYHSLQQFIIFFIIPENFCIILLLSFSFLISSSNFFESIIFRFIAKNKE